MYEKLFDIEKKRKTESDRLIRDNYDLTFLFASPFDEDPLK